MIEQTPSFIARHLRVCSYLGLLLCVAFVNVYSHYTSMLVNPVEQTWVVVCFSTALSIAPIKQWPSVVSTLIVSHICWQLILYKNEVFWPMVLLELSAGICIAFCSKYFNNLWQPSDFNDNVLCYLPGTIPNYFLYGVFISVKQWLVSDANSIDFTVTAEFILQHLHILEFAMAGNVSMALFYWYRNKFTGVFNPIFGAIAVIGQLSCLYVWPDNLIPVLLVMTISVYYLGLRGIAIPGLIVSLSLPFIAYNNGTLLDYVNELNYGFIILFSGLLGNIFFNVAEAAKKGEPYRVMLSKPT